MKGSARASVSMQSKMHWLELNQSKETLQSCMPVRMRKQAKISMERKYYRKGKAEGKKFKGEWASHKVTPYRLIPA